MDNCNSYQQTNDKKSVMYKLTNYYYYYYYYYSFIYYYY